MPRQYIKSVNTSGFTLLELLVVMAIFGVILAGILKVFNISNYTYKVQQEIADMQQNMRISKMFIERDVRMAGCDLKNFYIYESPVYPIEFENNTGPNGSDKLTVSYVDYSAACNDLPDLTTKNALPANSAEAEINENLGDPPYNAWDNEITCGDETFGGTPFKEFLACISTPDGSKHDVFWVTQVEDNGAGTSDKIQNHPYPAGCAGGCNKIVNSYPAGSKIKFFNRHELRRYTYYIEDNELKRDSLDQVDGVTTDIIATNIEDMQIALGLDTDNDGAVETWIGETNPAVLTNAQSSQVRLVRITILGKTKTQHRGYSNTRPAIENNAAGTIPDGYRRRKLQVTIKVRNLGLS